MASGKTGAVHAHGAAITFHRGGYASHRGGYASHRGSYASGNDISKTVPSESVLARRNLPPSFSRIAWQIESPKPIPAGLVVKNGSNMRPRFSAVTPTPESRMESETSQSPWTFVVSTRCL